MARTFGSSAPFPPSITSYDTMARMAATDLPVYPTKGHRRSLDQLWLTKLHSEGLVGLSLSLPEPPPELAAAVAEFNSGQFWQCHETLEELWLLEGYPLRLFYHGLIKAAVGMLHLQGRNCRGARWKLDEAVYTLAPFVSWNYGYRCGKATHRLQRTLGLGPGWTVFGLESYRRLAPGADTLVLAQNSSR